VVGRSATVLVALVVALVALVAQPSYRTVGRETALNHVAIVGD
jgi:Tfp pilus assembly protein PilE